MDVVEGKDGQGHSCTQSYVLQDRHQDLVSRGNADARAFRLGSLKKENVIDLKIDAKTGLNVNLDYE